jgi:hypothetical protein
MEALEQSHTLPEETLDTILFYGRRTVRAIQEALSEPCPLCDSWNISPGPPLQDDQIQQLNESLEALSRSIEHYHAVKAATA